MSHIRCAVLSALLIVITSNAWGEEIPIPPAPASPSFYFPEPKGPYSTGVRAFAWLDTSRAETITPEIGDFREVAVQIWYPALAPIDASRALYSPELDDMLAAGLDLAEGFQNFINMHASLRDAATTSFAGADLAISDQPWPVILFSPGGNVSRHWQTALAERIASQGFVFISMSHPHSTMDVAPNSGFSMSIDWGLNQENEEAAAAADDRLADILTADAVFILDTLKALSSTDPFFARFSLEKVGLAGHSRGGITVGRGCATDTRFAVCAVLDNMGGEREKVTGVRPPMLVLRSSWPEPRIIELHDYLSRTGSVAYDVELQGSNHFTCTDLPIFMPDLRVDTIEPIDGINNCAAVLIDFFDAFMRRHIGENEIWSPKIENEALQITVFERNHR